MTIPSVSPLGRPEGSARRRRNRSRSGAQSTPHAVPDTSELSAPGCPPDSATLRAGDAVAFAELSVPASLRAVLAGQGIFEPFPIQVATLPDSLAGRDVLGQGRTGSGKTLAFALPVVARLAGSGKKTRPAGPRGLVLVPTRELATQVCAVIAPLAEAVGLRVATVFGGVSAAPQIKAFKSGVDIIVACPGRLLDHMGTGALCLDEVEISVLDEADHMADQGFLPMVKRILDATPRNGQRLLFSATLAGGVDVIVKRYLNSPVSHQAGIEAPALLDHSVVVIAEEDRLDTLIALIGDGRAVVFARTKHRARQLARKLTTAGVEAVDMHGNLSQNARERNLAAFADGQARVMVATDIAARGIHVDDVPLVIHADPPIEHKAYTHRSGRTARAGSAGEVITIASFEQRTEVEKLLSRAGVRARWGKATRTTQGATTARSAPANSTPAATAHRRRDGRPHNRRGGNTAR
jgi:superfamily II DNA/RNA helicase